MNAARSCSIGLLGLPLCFAVVACAADDGKVSRADAATELASAYCGALYDCGCPDLGVAPPFDDKAQCLTEVEAAFEDALSLGDDAGLKFNENYVATIKGYYADAGCRSVEDLTYATQYGDTTGIELGNVGQTKMFFGNVEDRGTCQTTQIPFPISEFGRADDCAVDQYCDASNRCRSPYGGSGDGETCSTVGDCELGLLCVPVNDVSDLRCTNLPNAGGTCFGVGNLCENSYCDLADKTCKALPGPGETCAPDSPGTMVRCAQYSECDAQGICRKAPGETESCVSLCDEGLTCGAGSTCQTAVPAVCL